MPQQATETLLCICMLPRKVYPILGCIRLWGVNDLSKLMTPHNLVHQIRLAGHERVPKLCSAFKSYHYLCIDLYQPAQLVHIYWSQRPHGCGNSLSCLYISDSNPELLLLMLKQINLFIRIALLVCELAKQLLTSVAMDNATGAGGTMSAATSNVAATTLTDLRDMYVCPQRGLRSSIVCSSIRGSSSWPSM